ncbi:MAG: hypothetical protein ACFFD8_00265 [Candidatus Thorarchaeota archaeon]
MTPPQPTNQAEAINIQQEEAIKQFLSISNTITSILASSPLDHYETIKFVPTMLELSGPRFGAAEYRNTNNQLVLNLSQDLLTEYQKYLKPILWREAYLLHLPNCIRHVSQAADLGLYCYYLYGLKTKQQRRGFLQLWEAVSPPIEYPTYRYYPTAGFPFFDKVVDGSFLRKATQWFKPFVDLSSTMTTDAYTANMERWMVNYQRILRPIELKVLRGLNDCLTCSQIELADKLKLRQPTISQVIKRLAEKHLLRYIIFENYPILGLQPITAKFTVHNMNTISSLEQLIAKIRYALSIQEFDNLLLAAFIIPTERMTRFQQWMKQVASSLNLPVPELHFISERLHAQNFDLYNPKKGGWVKEYESINENFSRLIDEKWATHLPSVKFYKRTSPNLEKPIQLQHQDFIYMQRAFDTYLSTSQVKFYESHELRQAGYKESEHMAYRRRVKYLEKHKVISPPLGIGLIHMGLNASIYLYLESQIEETRRIITACQVFPHVAARIFDDGSGTATIRIPSSSAISVKTAISEYFTAKNVPVRISVHPSWKAFGWTGPNTVNPINYDFNKGKWKWTKDTLPLPKI